MACANFHGEYVAQGEDGRVYFALAQAGCDAVTIARSVDRFQLDGETLSVRFDGSFPTHWRGDVSERRPIAAVLIGDTLRLVAQGDSNNGRGPSRQDWWPLANGDLCWRIVDFGITWYFIAARYETDEDAAANRSGGGDLTGSCS